MIEALAPLADLVGLNTRLFRNALGDLSEDDGLVRPNERTNHVAFIAGHLVETRGWMARYVGLAESPAFGGTLEHATTLEQVLTMPSLKEIRVAWDGVSDRLTCRLEALSAADLAAPSSQRFPGVAATVLGGIGFLVQHESYHVGQLAYLRKYLGRPAMSYR